MLCKYAVTWAGVGERGALSLPTASVAPATAALILLLVLYRLLLLVVVLTALADSEYIAAAIGKAEQTARNGQLRRRVNVVTNMA